MTTHRFRSLGANCPAGKANYSRDNLKRPDESAGNRRFRGRPPRRTARIDEVRNRERSASRVKGLTAIRRVLLVTEPAIRQPRLPMALQHLQTGGSIMTASNDNHGTNS